MKIDLKKVAIYIIIAGLIVVLVLIGLMLFIKSNSTPAENNSEEIVDTIYKADDSVLPSDDIRLGSVHYEYRDSNLLVAYLGINYVPEGGCSFSWDFGSTDAVILSTNDWGTDSHMVDELVSGEDCYKINGSNIDFGFSGGHSSYNIQVFVECTRDTIELRDIPLEYKVDDGFSMSYSVDGKYVSMSSDWGDDSLQGYIKVMKEVKK